jgi:hypothetical protein
MHTLKSLKMIKMERTVSFDDCKLPPNRHVMPPTPMNTLYLPTLSPKPRRLAGGARRMLHPHQKVTKISGHRTMAIVMEMVKMRLAP